MGHRLTGPPNLGLDYSMIVTIIIHCFYSSPHLRVSDGYEDAVKELLYLLIEESGRVDCQLTQDQNL